MSKRTVWLVELLAVVALIFWPSATLDADTGLYQTDPVVLKQLEEFSNQLKELQTLVKSQNEVIKTQAIEIEALKTAREGKPVVSVSGAPEKEVEVPSWLEGMKQGGGD